MILSRNFVSDYIDLDQDLTIEQIGEDLTRVGNEYDSASPLINCTNLIVGEVVECKDHKDSDHLHVCKVNIGKEVLNIVCGAPNVRKGLKVIVAQVGAKLPGGEIKKGMIRGEESNGMLCSVAELGLDNKFLEDKDRDGICELPIDTEVGSDPIHVLGLDDEVVDLELTANRGDELSILGLAYELGAIYDKKVKDIDLDYKEEEKSILGKFDVEIKTDKCKLFLAKKVEDVVIKESPAFIKNRLIACGIRPINNVVDISNYVMLETGQPLHFYDADSLGEKLIVRMAEEGEVLKTLDGQDRILDQNDIVIANLEHSVGLAGVMGGFNTEVENTTKNIIIESAIFDSVSVRKTSKKVLRSEASNRFEKGLDPNRTYMAMKRAVTLLQKYASGKVLKDTIVYDKTDKTEKQIAITVKNINDVLGTEIKKEEIISVFTRLGFEIKEQDNTLLVMVPTRRIDISIKEDLIEEVGRIYGINNIEGKLPKLAIRRGSYDKKTRDLKNKLVDLGLNEVLTQIFIKEDMAHLYTNDEFETVKLLDPLSLDKAAIRYSLLPTLMRVYDYNKAHNMRDISIFEIAKGFYKKEEEYGEENKLAILVSGEYYKELGYAKKYDFYVLKGICEEILDFLGYENRYSFVKDENIPKELHPGQSASINVNGKNMGILGKIHPTVVKEDVYVIEINLDKLNSLKTGKMKYKEISKYPSIEKDLAFIIDKNINAGEVATSIKKAGGRLLTNIDVFDVYTGENVEKGKKSVAYKLTFQSNDRTLTEEEVMDVFNKVIEKITKDYKAILRDK